MDGASQFVFAGLQKHGAAEAIRTRRERRHCVDGRLDLCGIVAWNGAQFFGDCDHRQSDAASFVTGAREIHDSITLRVGPVLQLVIGAEVYPLRRALSEQVTHCKQDETSHSAEFHAVRF